jgi:anti-sigma factor RsiW
MRTEKQLWRDVVRAQLPDVALATRVAIPSLTDCVADRRMATVLLDELTSERAASVFAPLLRARFCAALRAALGTTRAARRDNWHPALARAVPERVRAVVRNWRAARPTIEPLVLAFRAFVATRMFALLRSDAATRSDNLEPAINA